MDGAKVAVIEDGDMMRSIVREQLESSGHKVVAEADSLERAFEVVGAIATGDIEADVIILDGNLRPRTDNGEDARRVAEMIRERGVTSKIIGFSLNPMATYGVEVDADPGKDLVGVLFAIHDFE